MTRITEVVVERRQLATAALRARNLPAPEVLTGGQVLLAVGEFALTVSNVTCAAPGDALCYWEFFPVGEELGTASIWGFVEVLASRCLGVELSERFYGHYSMVSHLPVAPAQAHGSDFVDASEHHRNLLSVYNRYLRCSSNPLYRVSDEALQIFLRPLFTTPLLFDDFLIGHASFDATDLLLSSASNKTAIDLAFLLQHNRMWRGQGYRIAGLTFAGNRTLTEGLGCYNEVLAHDRLDILDAGGSALSVDFADNDTLLGQLHQHLGDHLRYSCLVGAARWDQRGGLLEALPGPMPKLFFIPTQTEKHLRDWDGATFQAHLVEVWGKFLAFVGDWIQARHGVGGSEVLEVYQDLLAGRSASQLDYILSLNGGRGRRPILLDGGGEPVADDETGSTHGIGNALALSPRGGMERYRP